MQQTVRMRRHATTVGRQATWHVIVQMIPSVTCAMFLGMWQDNVQNPMFLEIAVGVLVGAVAAVGIVMWYAGTASS